MRYVYALLLGLLLAGSSFGQTITEVYFPQTIQGAGTFDVSDERRVPFACRMKVSGLQPNKTYRYYHGFTGEAGDISTEGTCIIARPSGDFVRIALPSFSIANRYGELTTDGTGSYEGWFVVEPSVSFYFETGVDIFFRLNLNDGNNGTNVVTRLTSDNTVHVINFSSDASGGTALRSTTAAGGVGKNFVLLYDNTTVGSRPVAGTFIESDGTDNSLANYYADFYANHVNGVDKAWGVIIPNNLGGGIQKIVQYGLADGSEIGSKTSTDGFWAKSGGGTVGTANATGGLGDVIVLDGAVVTLGAAVQQPQTISFGTLAAKTYGDIDYPAGATASSGLTFRIAAAMEL
ncbi:hypothetical protein [Paraflavitalea speifideaquila]|uniref:hypothetical protein n=1 Tax=Paraflavitalea speifideaquila TaxID=3076558 RepID=UPI0028E47227|nr:hypothetical protein [Paraflavitalea speifideiaquila]